MSEPTLSDVLVTLGDVLDAVKELSARMDRLESEVRALREDVKTLDAVQLNRFNEFRRELPALVKNAVREATRVAA